MLRSIFIILISVFVLFCPLAANSVSGADLVSLLKRHSTLKYVTMKPQLASLRDQHPGKNISVKLDKFNFKTFDELFLDQAELSQNEDDDFIINFNGTIFLFEFIGNENKDISPSFLNYRYIKNVLTVEFSEEALFELSADAIRALLPDIKLKVNILDGFTDYVIFEGKYARGYGCYRSEDRYLYGQIWISGNVYFYSIENHQKNEWKEFIVNMFSKFRGLEVLPDKKR